MLRDILFNNEVVKRFVSEKVLIKVSQSRPAIKISNPGKPVCLYLIPKNVGKKKKLFKFHTNFLYINFIFINQPISF